MTALHLRITGRVQGVFYRGWAVGKARGLGLRGWIRNRGDGSVEALVIGEEDAVRAFAEACRKGPRSARVIGIAETPASDDGAEGFNQRPTE